MTSRKPLFSPPHPLSVSSEGMGGDDEEAAAPSMRGTAYLYKAATSWFYSGVWKKRSLALVGTRLSYTKHPEAAADTDGHDTSAGVSANAGAPTKARSASLPEPLLESKKPHHGSGKFRSSSGSR